ncbi:hypothetical protein [Reyranella sp.]|uniref:hypothetical protein n=1 Tax=Reyranella sp. TaxID=1929291 RepID=UPI003D0A502E
MWRALGFAVLVVAGTASALVVKLFYIPAIFIIVLRLLLPPMPHPCYTETLDRQNGIGGYDFEISDTSCKTFAADEAVTIFVTRPGDPRKTALFKYTPGDEHPVITLTDPHTITISARHVSSIHFRKSGWADMSVRYDLAAIEFPEKYPDWVHRRQEYFLCRLLEKQYISDWDECSPYATDDHLFRPK